MTVGRLARIMLFPAIVIVAVIFFISLMFGCGGDDEAAAPDYSSDNVEYIELATPRGKIACVLHYSGGISCDWGRDG